MISFRAITISFFFKCKCLLVKHVNIKMGVISGLTTGFIVFVINLNHGVFPALAGFFKQFMFNLLMAGYNARTCEKVVRLIRNVKLACLLGSIIPTLQAFIVLYSIHYYGGTPKPMASTLWQVIANLFIFYSLAYYYKVRRFQSADLKSVNIPKRWSIKKWKTGFLRRVS